eukprot:scaffold78623_cov76-Phaeocystis_antarctica.AAC.2
MEWAAATAAAGGGADSRLDNPSDTKSISKVRPISDFTPVGHCDSAGVADAHTDRETTRASRIPQPLLTDVENIDVTLIRSTSARRAARSMHTIHHSPTKRWSRLRDGAPAPWQADKTPINSAFGATTGRAAKMGGPGLDIG